MKKMSRLATFTALLLMGGLSQGLAVSIQYGLSTDSTFKTSSGTTIPDGVEGRFGYFAASSTSATAYNDTQVSSLLTVGMSGTAAIAALDASFFSLGSFKFGTYINPAGTESTLYGGLPVGSGYFVRGWDSLQTKPFTFDAAGFKPYLYIKSGSEYLVVGSEIAMPTGVDIDTSGAWGITGVSSYDPDTEETFSPTARLVGTLGSFDAASNTFSTIPEPSSAILLALGLPMLVALRRSLRNGS